MSGNIVASIKGVVGTVFSDRQNSEKTKETNYEQWAATNGPLCCVIVVGLLDGEPTKTNITDEFTNNALYIGGPDASERNRLRITYTIPDSLITNAHHNKLSTMNDGIKEKIVAEQVMGHYNDPKFVIASLKYSYDDNEGTITNKALKVMLIMFQDA